MSGEHRYAVDLTWTGNRGEGTADYRAYDRTHEVRAAGKPAIAGSADRVFRGDAERWNPEDLLVVSLSACHMLSYLHLCATAGIVVVGYEDHATGVMTETGDGGGRFTEVTLHPRVVVAAAGVALREQAHALHESAHRLCFIAASVNFPVNCDAVVTEAS